MRNRKSFDVTPANKETKLNEANNYTTRYRIIKTILMIVAWISFGMNFEIIATAMEDLIIQLNSNYEKIAFGLVIRNIGYMTFTLFIGLLMDRLLDYSETIMVVAKLLMIIPNFFIPWMRSYWITMLFLLMQGVAQAIYDVGGNQIILRLWKGISNSPVNAMHAGYGIGAMITLNLIKPFIKFDSLRNLKENITFDNATNQLANIISFNESMSPLNETINKTDNSLKLINTLTPDDIQLHVPYAIAGLFGLLISVCFLIAQYYERRNTTKIKNKVEMQQTTVPLNKNASKRDEESDDTFMPFLQNILFTDKRYKMEEFFIVLTIIFLLFILFLSISGFMNVLNFYMLTYLTKGPAKMVLNTFLILQTLYWVFFIVGRFLAAYLAFKMNSMLFFFLLILANLAVSSLYVVPYFNSIQSFYWFFTPALGITSGPLIPSCFMVANHMLKGINAFLVSLFCISFGVGAILFLYVTGALLERFKPAPNWFYYTDADPQYVIPSILMVCICVCTVIYLLVLGFYKFFKNTFENDVNENDDA